MKSILDRLRNITSNPVFVEIGLVLLISSLMAVLADKVNKFKQHERFQYRHNRA